MGQVAGGKVHDVAGGGHDGAVRQPWRYLAEAAGQERERHRPAGHGVPDEDEDEGPEAGSRQAGDRLAGGHEGHEGERAEEADADQRGGRAGQRAEDRVERQHAPAGGQQGEGERGADPPPQPQPPAEQEQADAADDAGDEQADLEDEDGLAGAVAGRQRGDVEGAGLAVQRGRRGREGHRDRLLLTRSRRARVAPVETPGRAPPAYCGRSELAQRFGSVHGRRTGQRRVSPIADGPPAAHHLYVGIRILIVDDDASFLRLAAELLAGRGFDVLGRAMDGDEALAAAIRECPDGILLDINLPGPDGFATAAALSAACPSARIVLTSADVGHVAAEILRGCSADAFVPKEELATADLGDLFRRSGT
jgi:CheY-like chemotaxis protein